MDMEFVASGIQAPALKRHTRENITVCNTKKDSSLHVSCHDTSGFFNNKDVLFYPSKLLLPSTFLAWGR